MKTPNNAALVLGIYLLGTSPLLAAAFNTGSDGSYGPLNVTNDTKLPMPSNGVFHCTTINVTAGKLTFTRNPLNTPVYLLATGDISIAAAGSIDVSGEGPDGIKPGKGGPGGFDGGFGALGAGLIGGDGQGPGGGKAGVNVITVESGAFATPWTSPHASPKVNTNVYGNTLLIPLIGGSGGGAIGGSYGGGGGGGAILLASSTKVTVDGYVGAVGGRIGTATGDGAGGAIRIVAPVVDGTGRLDTIGGNAGPSLGRVRIDSLDRLAHRRIRTDGAKETRGSQMVVPLVLPRLDIVQAAGTDIPEGTEIVPPITLPLGSPTNQIVRVQAKDFTNDVSIVVKITPENGPSRAFTAVIPNSGNPSFADVSVEIPLDVVCYVHAWTR